MIEGRGVDVRITGGRNVRVQIIADDEQDVGLLGGVRGGSRKCQDTEGENTFFHFVFILSSKGWIHWSGFNPKCFRIQLKINW